MDNVATIWCRSMSLVVLLIYLILSCCIWQVDSGLKDDLVLGDPNAPRFVLWNGKLSPVPSKPTDLPFFDLMSFGGKLRAGFGALGLRPPPPVRPLELYLSLIMSCQIHLQKHKRHWFYIEFLIYIIILTKVTGS